MTVNLVTVDALVGPPLVSGFSPSRWFPGGSFPTEHHGLHLSLARLRNLLVPTRGWIARRSLPPSAPMPSSARIGELLMIYCRPANDYCPTRSRPHHRHHPRLCLEKACLSASLRTARGRVCPARHHWRATTPSGLTMKSRASCSGATSSTPTREWQKTSAAGGTC